MKRFCHKRRRKHFGTCLDCTGYMYKARIHRNARDPNELLLVKNEYYDHLDMQKTERRIYYKHRINGLRGEAVSVMVDGMDQSKLIIPHTKVPQKDVSNCLETKITGPRNWSTRLLDYSYMENDLMLTFQSPRPLPVRT